MTVSFSVRNEFIQLDQLLKACGLAGSGGEAHAAIAAGRVEVDGHVESRKRAKLRPGQIVTFAGQKIRLFKALDPSPPQPAP
jgi:ribosome-associated protein